MLEAVLEEQPPAIDTPSIDETLAQARKLLDSPPFQHAESMRVLLAFLADRYALSPAQPVKELELAISVYKLTSDKFDPQVDSAIRVKVGRLRSKIQDYYASHGRNDTVVLSIPKGSYCLLSHFRDRQDVPSDPATASLSAAAAANGDTPRHPETASFLTRFSNRHTYLWAGMLTAGILIGILGSLTAERISQHSNLVPEHLSSFWGDFVANNQPTIAVYSNPRLAGYVAHGGLHYFDENTDKPDTPINLGYAGAGDVESVHDLTHLFDGLRRNLQVESGALLSWDLAKESNLIFIGRPEQNPALAQIPRLREFYFKYNVGIVNSHPQPGESSMYQYTAADGYDYAVIAFIPGIHPPEHTLIMAGNTTIGSLAAVEFLSNETSVAELLKKLNMKPGQKTPYFEALLKTRINNDVPVWTSLLAVRSIPANDTSWVNPRPDER